MSAPLDSKVGDPAFDEKKADVPANHEDPELGSDTDSLAKGDVLSLESVDPVLNAKMHIVNNVRFAASIRRQLTKLHTCRLLMKSASHHTMSSCSFSMASGKS
jgi:hypothetical protein